MTDEKLIHKYVHTVQYYETDSMRIVHHSNYIRWMEEARLDYFKAVGIGYDEIEARGIVIPVLGVSCEYKTATKYGEEVKILEQVERFNGLRFSVEYLITDLDEKVIHATAHSEHCFLDTQLRPVNIKKAAPDIYALFEPYKK